MSYMPTIVFFSSSGQRGEASGWREHAFVTSQSSLAISRTEMERNKAIACALSLDVNSSTGYRVYIVENKLLPRTWKNEDLYMCNSLITRYLRHALVSAVKWFSHFRPPDPLPLHTPRVVRNIFWRTSRSSPPPSRPDQPKEGYRG